VDSGFYAACAGLRAQSQALEVAAHNLANLNTVGYRGQQTSFQSLLALAGSAAGNVLNYTINNFGVLEGSHLDMSAGNLENTGNPLDLGLQGPGFFVVKTDRGTRYTRDGSFRVSRAGQLTTAAGDLVLAEDGKTGIRVPSGPVSISSDGTVSANGAITGRIRLVEFPPDTKLVPEGGALLAAPDSSPRPAKKTSLQQGALESSNVEAIRGTVALIGVQRQAEMMQRVLSMFHSEFNRIAAVDLPHV